VWISAAGADALETAQRERIEGAGFSLRAISLDEIEKAGGSLRCCIAEVF
jgi:N-dimethylarginine dimethylaminohydrolase